MTYKSIFLKEMYNKREKMHSTHIKCEICMRQLDYGQTVTNQVFVQFLMLQSLETGTRELVLHYVLHMDVHCMNVVNAEN